MFTPAILAFGAQPRLPIDEYNQMLQNLTSRMDLMIAAHREYEAIVAALHIRLAMNTTSPNESTQTASTGDEVLVYRERIGWDVPYTFLYRDGRLSIVLKSNGLKYLFHSTVIKPYQRPNISITDLLNRTDESPSEITAAHLVEIVHDEEDPRFIKSRKAEYDGIVAKGGVKVVNANSLPPDANNIENRYDLSVKNPVTDAEKFKAIWILQGLHDKFRHRIANDSPVITRMMYRVIIAFSATLFNSTL